MGKFLRDKDGNMVTIGGAPVLERSLDKKPRDCEECGFDRWILGDKIFIIQSVGGEMQWICPDCAVAKGLPREHYKRNFYSKAPVVADEDEEAAANKPRNQSFGASLLSGCTGMDMMACFCRF